MTRIFRYDAIWPGVRYKAPAGWRVASFDNYIRPFGMVVILEKEGGE